MEQQNQLQKSLKKRHLVMISIGGIIGAGLFVGAGSVINSTGPAAILSYALAGLIVILVMRMLGEMAAVNPESGSFATYAHQAIGPWAGFTIGWLYWFFWVVVIAIEAIAGAKIIHDWFPVLPIWAISLFLTILLTLTNAFSVKSYGEFEYWFSMIKVVAISLFMLLGLAILLGFVPGIPSPGFSNLTGHGGFMPKGITSIFVGITTVFFAFFGAEIAAIAAGESEDPQRLVVKAIKSVVWRILLFYVGSVTILVFLLPWNDAELLKSPYVTLLEKLGVNTAAQIMNIIVLVAVLSVMNSALYTNSRMLFALAQKGHAPKGLLKVNKRKVPVRALLVSTLFSYISAIFNFISPDQLFLFLVNSSGAIAILVYIIVAISHLRMRRKIEKENPEALRLKMWFFPYLTYLTIAVLIGILISMAFIESMRSQLYLTLLVTTIVIGSYFLLHRYEQKQIVNEKEAG